LGLRPWECPPCLAGPTTDTRGRDYENDPKAIAMKQQLIDAQLSIFEPDIPAALARVEAEKRSKIGTAAPEAPDDRVVDIATTRRNDGSHEPPSAA
jgi:hypothetical protein